jgi:hypothetical protein
MSCIVFFKEYDSHLYSLTNRSPAKAPFHHHRATGWWSINVSAANQYLDSFEVIWPKRTITNFSYARITNIPRQNTVYYNIALYRPAADS